MSRKSTCKEQKRYSVLHVAMQSAAGAAHHPQLVPAHSDVLPRVEPGRCWAPAEAARARQDSRFSECGRSSQIRMRMNTCLTLRRPGELADR